MEEKNLLIRIFFDNGSVETRPVNRVRFMKQGQVCEITTPLQRAYEEVEKTNKDVLFVYIDSIRAVQLFVGTFKDSR